MYLAISGVICYQCQTAIIFECGAQDTHIPPSDALHFEEQIRALYPNYGDRFRVNLHPGVGHEIRDEQREAGLQWLLQH